MPAKGSAMSDQHKEKIRNALIARHLCRSEKHCPRCDTTKPIAEFKKRYTGTPKAYCIPCEQEYNRVRQKRYWNSTPHLHAKRAKQNHKTSLKLKYGMSVDQYWEMYESQNGCCAICKSNESGSRHKLLSVDHDHDTGVVRGLLCNTCNRGIGLLKDSPEVLSSAIEYLTRRKQPGQVPVMLTAEESKA